MASKVVEGRMPRACESQAVGETASAAAMAPRSNVGRLVLDLRLDVPSADCPINPRRFGAKLRQDDL